MFNSEAESLAAKYLYFGVPFVTIFLLAGTNTDPVNVPKLLALGGLASGLLAITIAKQLGYIWTNFKVVVLSVLIFIFAILNSVINSDSPLVQNIYGTYGRSTGALTYIWLAAVFLASLQMRNVVHIRNVMYGLILAGVVNIVYCAWVLAFGDFLPWDNPYGKILGLFGNPDFISAYLGMYIVCSIAFCWGSQVSTRFKLVLVTLSAAAFFEILKSHAIQGLVVTIGGVVIILFFVIRSGQYFKNLEWVYSFTILVIGVLAVFGTLQKGPFQFIYKGSVSLRGSYWHAGLGMGSKFPFTGVGMDAYGDWYRRTRPPVALVNMPGVNTVSNASHNVVIDFFAFGGFPLLLSYLFLLLLGAIAIFRVVRRSNKYNPMFAALSAVWSCYQVQSLVSINQIGLAIWGWVLTGLLISYELITRSPEEIRVQTSYFRRSSSNVKNSIVSPHLVAFLGLLIGAFLSCPPLNADAKWFHALNSHNAQLVEESLTPSLLNPPDSYKYALAVNLFSTSKLPDLSYKYAKTAVEFNKDYFPAWKQLYFSPGATPADKQRALMNMNRLDPLNPDVTAP